MKEALEGGFIVILSDEILGLSQRRVFRHALRLFNLHHGAGLRVDTMLFQLVPVLLIAGRYRGSTDTALGPMAGLSLRILYNRRGGISRSTFNTSNSFTTTFGVR